MPDRGYTRGGGAGRDRREPMLPYGGGGRSRGGGAARDHPAGKIIDLVSREYAAEYDHAQERTERLLKEHVMHATGGGGSTRGGGAGRLRVGYDTLPEQRQRELLRELLFTGTAWAAMVEATALLLYDTNARAVDMINAAMPGAFADGANLSAWDLRRQSAGRAGSSGYSPLPYTAATVLLLISDKLLSMPRRNLNKRKDVRWTEKQLRKIASAALLLDLTMAELPGYIARRLTSGARESMNLTARVALSGAYDAGVYQTGLDAQADGLDVEKTWLAIMDMHVRDSHAHLHLTTIPINELFHGYYGVLRYPHDPKASPREIYRCRCRLAVHLAGHAPKTYSYRLLPSEVFAYRQWRDQAISEAGQELYEGHRMRLKNGKSGLTGNPESGTISLTKEEMFRRTDASRSGFKFNSDEHFDRLTINARKNGAVIIRGDPVWEQHLQDEGAAASTIGNTLIFRKQVTVSEVLEETRHFEQNRTGLNDDKPAVLRTILNEIEARDYIFENAKKYQVPRVELDFLQRQYEGYQK